MYEPEVNSRFESIDTVPAAIVAQLRALPSVVKARTTLPWGEHCTECAWPTCYTTCELYDPRADGGCRLFIDGMVRVDLADDVRPYLLKLRFKRWGKLWTVGNLAGRTPEAARRSERNHILVGAVARHIPLAGQLKTRALGKVSYLRRRGAETAVASAEAPDCFLFECYNPNAAPLNLTLSIRKRQAPQSAFQRILTARAGYHCERISFHEIRRVVDVTQPFEVEIVPNEADDTLLYVGLMEFVWLRHSAAPKPAESPGGHVKPLKCIVWDLDNTLWSGTLIEDGPERIRLREDVVELIKDTDRRGILHSIASKNNPDDAAHVLESMGLAEYFLHPQVSWNPKSQSVALIAELLNLGVDSLMFVDDQPFEREEVSRALPSVTVLDAASYREIASRPECRSPITDESRQRRAMYRQEEQRIRIKETFQGDYRTFLRDCQIRLTLSPLTAQNSERVYELAQRTNQMNFSGNRYPRQQLTELRKASAHETYVMECRDRFGSYGIVGFAVVDVGEPRLLDLMFSCRVQAKHVEHAFLAFIISKHARTPSRDFHANYRRTKKNESSGRVFEDVGFEVISEHDGVLNLKFPADRGVIGEDVVQIAEHQPVG